MASTAKKQDTTNPLQQLSELLEQDMRDVNAVILERMQSPVALIPQLATYLIAAGGKRIRPLLTLAFTQIFNGDMSHAHKLSASVEFIHTATLLHDDVVDESEERRGKEAANLVFGNQATVLVGDFLFSRAFELMTDTQNIEVQKILARASSIIAQGEVMQLSAANNLDTSMDDYIEIITGKTAALFAAACEVGPVLCGASQEEQAAAHNYGLNMGIAFQIADDALDYSADRAQLGKAVGDDFREGKITAPILFALEKADKKELTFWQRTLSNTQTSEDDLKTAQDILAKHNAIQNALDLANTYGKKAKESLHNLPDSQLKPLLSSLIDFTITRKS